MVFHRNGSLDGVTMISTKEWRQRLDLARRRKRSREALPEAQTGFDATFLADLMEDINFRASQGCVSFRDIADSEIAFYGEEVLPFLKPAYCAVRDYPFDRGLEWDSDEVIEGWSNGID